jgi:phosphoribosylformimino-5-aminoimidazole carboxamide ribotide isomerase
MAHHWQAEGAQRLHVVDLDGARDGIRANAEAIRRVLQSVAIPVQVGGGIRSSLTVQTLLDEGAARVVVGTTAAEHPDELGEWVTAFGSDSIIVAVDAVGGRVATHGWQSVTDLDVLGFCRLLKKHGVERVLYTDVARDGRLSGPDIEGTRAIAGELKVIGSGGVATVEHLRELADAGAEGAIIGTALYEGRLKLGDALVTAC